MSQSLFLEQIFALARAAHNNKGRCNRNNVSKLSRIILLIALAIFLEGLLR